MSIPRAIVDGASGMRREAVETLALAFQDDPALQWIMPDAAARRRRLPRFFDWLFADHLRHGMILAAPAREAVTLWRLPGKVHHHDPITPAELWRMLRIFGPAIGRAERTGRHLAKHIPAGEDHLYLRYAAVRPDAQGKAWGGHAIRAGIAEANRLGVDVCLETAKPGNVAIYQRLGFGIVDEWQVPGGPHFWTMLRPRD
ncbi:GNAT family N-acetyltransferase [Erythrobacter oryzae]|uniref:GNAT family N-acetyltransferase n=1 Tax=Erythrobacter oryzae TaxID=3019556 RepID=UPI002557AE95|nr:GNAT family N-acetyltransferase [Erythrobacter sp. COR-2]